MLLKYSTDKLRAEMVNDVQGAAEEAKHDNQAQSRQVDEVLGLVGEMIQQHSYSLGQTTDDIIEGCFKEYGEHLRTLEVADIDALKKRVGQLKGVQKKMSYDLRESDDTKKMLL